MPRVGESPGAASDAFHLQTYSGNSIEDVKHLPNPILLVMMSEGQNGGRSRRVNRVMRNIRLFQTARRSQSDTHHHQSSQHGGQVPEPASHAGSCLPCYLR